MTITSKTPNIYKYSYYIFIALFAIVAAIWLYNGFRFHVLSYQEEVQLFRTDFYYFHGYITQPGGLTKYIGSFFTQLYHFGWLAPVILTFFISLSSITLYNICSINKASERIFLLSCIFPVLLLLGSANRDVNLWNIIGICFALLAFWGYTKVSNKYRYIGGVIIYLLLFFIAGGNAMLFVGLVVIRELFSPKHSYIYLLGLILLAVAVPYLSHLFIYTSLIEDTYYALTPFGLKYKVQSLTLAWLSAPAIYLLYQIISKKSSLFEKVKPVKVIIPYFLLLFGFIYWSLSTSTKKYTENVAHIAYAAERAEWDTVLRVSSEYDLDVPDPLTIFFTNIALSEKGVLLSEMFHYPQTGTLGLYVSWHTNYILMSYLSELYYRAGIWQEAEHTAYETLVMSPTEHGSKALRRLLYVSMLKGDSSNFEKYNRLMRQSPVYKSWAEDLRAEFYTMQSNPDYQIEGTPRKSSYEDFFINHGSPEYNFVQLLKADPKNKKAFEYLVATALLQKRLNVFLALMNEKYNDVGYEKMPRHIEEALIVCRYVINGSKDIVDRFPLSTITISEFAEYDKASANATYPQAKKNLEEKYGHTYWHYFLNKKPMTLEQIQMSSRY